MANTKISALTAGAPAQAGDLIPIDRSGTNYSLQVGDILTSPALTGTPTAPTPSASDNSTKIATTASIRSILGNFGLPSSGLLGAYAFTDAGTPLTAADSSGNGNNAPLGDQCTITNLSVSANVATITTANDFVAGDVVRLDGLTTTPSLNFSTTGATLTVGSSGLSSSQFTAVLVHANIASGAETGTVTARCPTWIAGTGGLQFTATGNGISGGQYLRLPAALNAAQSMVLFVGHQPLNIALGAYANLVVSDSGVHATTSGLAVVDAPPVSNNGNTALGSGSTVVILQSYNNGYIGGTLTPGPIGKVCIGFNLGVAANSTTDQYYINGTLVRGSGSSVAFNTSLAGQYRIGGVPALFGSYQSWFTGQVYYAVFYNRALTAAEMAQVSNFLNQTVTNRGVIVGAGISAAGNMILSDGDSIQNHDGGWMQYNTIDPNQIGPFNQAAVSISGDNAIQMIQRSWAADSILPPSSPYPSNTTPGGLAIAEFMIGTNSLGALPANAQTDNQICAAYSRARRNAGWNKIIQSTVMDTSTDSYHDNFNWFIRKNYKTYADGLADVAADPALGADGANSNNLNNYYFDNGVHPSNAGQMRIAAIKSRVINHIIGNTLESGSPNVAGTTATINNTALTSNVATYTTTTNHHFSVNETIAVTGLSNNSGVYNVTQVVTSVPTPSTFTFAITHANIGSGADSGTASKGTSYTMLDTDTYLEVSHALGNMSIYLPTSLGYTGGKVWIKNLKSGDGHTVTLLPCATLTTVVYAAASTSMDGSNNLTVNGNHNFNIGDTPVLSGFTTQTFLNGQTVTITSITGTKPNAQTAYVATGVTHATYGTTTEAAGAIGTKTFPAETIDTASSLVLANGAMACLRSALSAPETGLNNWEEVTNG